MQIASASMALPGELSHLVLSHSQHLSMMSARPTSSESNFDDGFGEASRTLDKASATL
jgi:hypothetical protein